ncbi:DUF4932 domain-containing protein [Oceanirhabdus seepicola]|uniref:DUF4932 domain-containing protein n=1 Tax=Oceanirhabdus seepicola TaxID=2828781 RepID=A0A9J6P6X6_9CLOT|nr:DUF4932 domain-containing protein [Oceanirhabdus seepicola]MCM1991256.1 DUF4932 domain-containing protein [Oceanirhabdus seepicola]
MKNRGKYYLIGLVLILIAGITIVFMLNNTKAQKADDISSNNVSENTEDIIELKPIVQSVNGINVFVDPRIELLAAVQLISDYDKITGLITRKEFQYKKDMKDYFSKFSSHEAVKLFNKMSKNGFNYDAPPTAMLYLSNPLNVSKKQDFDDYIIKRAGGFKNLENFYLALSKFAGDTNFNEFYESHTDFYKKVVEENAKAVKEGDYIKDIEDYYGMKQNSYNIILSPLFHPGGFGPRVRNEEGSYDIYSIQGPSSTEKNIPMFGNVKSFKYLAWHEFSHSFVNPTTEENLDEINKYSKLYTPLAKAMNSQAYNTWETCVNEHIVRAVTSRLSYLNEGEKSYNKAINYEKSNDFYYVEALCEKLEEYENNRDKYKSFTEFYPELVAVFKEFSEQDLGKDFYKVNFIGPINKVYTMGKSLTIIIPTNEEDEKIEKDIEKIANKFFGENAKIITDKEALDKDLSEENIVVYGTVEGNLWLEKYSDDFPFKIEEDKITADKVYEGGNLRFITCMPNPFNQNNGMVIYTAQKGEDVININSVFHGPTDYIIAKGKKELNSDYYIKDNAIWEFE